MYSLYDDQSLSGRVSPFGYRRIAEYLLLPAAFRSLSRPSSALSAKASTLRSLLLDHFYECIALHSMVGSLIIALHYFWMLLLIKK